MEHSKKASTVISDPLAIKIARGFMAQTENVDPNSNQLDPSLLQQGQSVFNQQGEEFVVVNADPTNTEKIIMPKNQQNAETPDGVETVDDQNLVNNFYLQSRRSPKNQTDRVYGNTIKRRRVKLTTKREAYFDDNPKIYVGTCRKYNEGSLKGKWFDLTDYVGVDDFYEDAIDFHSDERDPELMFQDWEHIPDDFIGESWISKEFWEYMELTESMDEDNKEAFDIYVNNLGISMKDDVYGAVEGFKEAYVGRFDDLEDYGRYLVDDLGGPRNAVIRSFYHNYIDYKQLGYDLNLDGEIPEGMNLEDYAKEYVDDIGEEEIIDRYFDYKRFGRELRYDHFEENGHVFRDV